MPQFREVVYGVTPPISSNSNQLVTAEWVLFKTKGILPDNLKMTVPWTTVSDDFTEATLDLSKTTLVTDWGTPETFFTTYKGIQLYVFGNSDPIYSMPADGATTEGDYLEGKIKITRNSDILTFKSWWHYTDNDGNETPYPVFKKQLPSGKYEKQTSKTITWAKLPNIITAQCSFTSVSYGDNNTATIDFDKQADVQQVLYWTTDAKTFFDNYTFIWSIDGYEVNATIPADGSSTEFNYYGKKVTLSRAGHILTFDEGQSKTFIRDGQYYYAWAKNKDVLI